MEKIICDQKLNDNSYISAHLLREPIYELIKKDNTFFNRDCFISKKETAKYRNMHVASLISKENENFDLINKEVLEAITGKTFISNNLEDQLSEKLTTGQKIADKVATFGGSWAFIISFSIFILLWMAINIWLLASQPFDPYPFILLNLFLSTLAAFQAPIIMMSQNRQEEKDRKRGENDYRVNLKAELEIKLLHEKIDHLVFYQNKKLFELIELQMDYLENINGKL